MTFGKPRSSTDHDGLSALERRIHSECAPLRRRLPKLRVSEPFHGLGSFTRFAELGALRYSHPNSYELDPRFGKYYEIIYGGHTVKVGVVGDMLAVTTQSFEDSEGLVAGPMCTAWAGNGSKDGATSIVSFLYSRTTDWVIELAHRGVLLFYCIENSGNIAKTEAKGTRQAFVERELLKLECAVPFFKHGHEAVALYPTLPHVRNRHMLRGMRRDVMLHNELPRPIANLPEVPLVAILDFEIPNKHFAELSKIQQANMESYVERVQEHAAQGKVGQIAVVEVGRSCYREYGATIMYDKIPPLRASGAEIWVLSTHDLHKPEALQGK